MKSKVTAGLFGILLGGIGVHKFYLGQVGSGILYVLFCWTGIPALIGMIEGIMYLTMSDDEFNLKYNPTMFVLDRIEKRDQAAGYAGGTQPPVVPAAPLPPVPQPSGAPQTVAVPAGGRPVALFGLSGPYRGQTIPVPSEGLILGRESASCNLIISADGVSRRNSRVAKTPSGGGWVVEDLGSTNGTYVFASNGWARVSGQLPLSTGSRIRLCEDGPEFEFRPN